MSTLALFFFSCQLSLSLSLPFAFSLSLSLSPVGSPFLSFSICTVFRRDFRVSSSCCSPLPLLCSECTPIPARAPLACAYASRLLLPAMSATHTYAPYLSPFSHSYACAWAHVYRRGCTTTRSWRAQRELQRELRLLWTRTPPPPKEAEFALAGVRVGRPLAGAHADEWIRGLKCETIDPRYANAANAISMYTCTHMYVCMCVHTYVNVRACGHVCVCVSHMHMYRTRVA